MWRIPLERVDRGFLYMNLQIILPTKMVVVAQLVGRANLRPRREAPFIYKKKNKKIENFIIKTNS